MIPKDSSATLLIFEGQPISKDKLLVIYAKSQAFDRIAGVKVKQEELTDRDYEILEECLKIKALEKELGL